MYYKEDSKSAKLNLLYVWVLLVVCGCSTRAAHLYHTSFEETHGWAPEVNITSEQAYSGHYAAKVEGPLDKAIALHLPLQDLALAHQIRFSAQVWLAHLRVRNPQVVAQVWRQGNVIYSKELRLSEVVRRYQQWVPITMLLVLPDDIKPTDELRITLAMEPVTGNAYLDDLTLYDAS